MNTVLKFKNNHAFYKFAKPEYIAAIGGSAGFLKPLLKFFDHTQNDNISYVVLRHIGRDVRSELASIIRLHSALRIIEADYNMQVERTRCTSCRQAFI